MRNIVSPLDGIRSPFGRRFGFVPSQLFASGEIGAWYDPSDLTTMFQDSAGTTPVTAVGQKVGLILDKSQGAVRTQLLTNGPFATDTTGWTTQNATAAVSSGQVTLTNTAANGGIYQAITTVVGRVYFVSIDLVGVTGGSNVMFFIKSDSTNWASPNRINLANGVSAVQTYASTFTATATTTYIHIINGNVTVGHSVTVDNASVIDISGNHASQITDTAKPTLSARVNLLTYSEQFDNAAWNKAALNTTGTPAWVNVQTAPDGTMTADKMIENTAAAQHYISRTATVVSGFAYTLSVYLKAGERTWAFLEFYGGIPAGTVYVNLSTGAKGTATGSGSSVTVTDSGNGWWRVVLPGFVASSTSAAVAIYTSTGNGVNSYTGDGTSGIFIWGADLRSSTESTSLPVYQRIAAATDYDTTGFPYYLSFDGVDDSLVTGTINPGSVDKAQIFAGVRKLSDPGLSIIAEYSASTGANAGSFILAGYLTGYLWRSRGSVDITGAITASPAAPSTNILTGIGDIVGDNAVLRSNAMQVALDTGNQGTGNFGSYLLYIGARAGTGNRLTGNLYSLIVRFSAANLSDSVISQAETWVNTKTLAY